MVVDMGPVERGLGSASFTKLKQGAKDIAQCCNNESPFRMPNAA
jgi:hypothetical protein